ncbi:MAG: ribosome biogenesis GTPase YlqF [Gracilibacteraceae bacterium]|jgi:ribosome biogenesis GTPase A|nr:ribosome biogenesis GTPase YlqF [Gracilibacteraceae bacterium]
MIQWYPGHMAKTGHKITEQLSWMDAVLELADARAPDSSRSPLLREMLRGKPRLLILNKADLADPGRLQAWTAGLGGEYPALETSAATGQGIGRIAPALDKLLCARREKDRARGLRPKPWRIMVVGIPNIGKSSLINRLTGGAQAKTGNKPGVTRGPQWIKLRDRLELLDTPGILWPKFEDEETGRKLAATGAIRDEVFDTEELAEWLLRFLRRHYSDRLRACYGGEPPADSLDSVGRRRGCLTRGGEVDTLRTAQTLLKEFRAGKIGRVTLD